MIKTLSLRNFKCFREQSFALRPLNLLTGQNGMGKSSVIQSLLVLRQSELARMLDEGLLLNGDLVRLGNAQSVLYEGATEEIVRIGIRAADETAWSWAFDASRGDAEVLPLRKEPSHSTNPAFGSLFHATGLRYLAAERIGPREAHVLADYHTEQLRDLGSDGTYAVAYLASHADETVAKPMLREAPSTRLLDQVTAWMSAISPGIRLSTEKFNAIDRVSLGIRFSSGRAFSGTLRPTSVGFGVSYTLPVLVALLSARSEDVVLIENPEAHLHPRGQMAVGELLSCAAAAGVQVIVETHSDHVLNGARLCVKRGIVMPEQVGLFYFARGDEEERIVHHVASPTIDKDGRIDEWPEGFFDQWDLALEQLL